MKIEYTGDGVRFLGKTWKHGDTIDVSDEVGADIIGQNGDFRMAGVEPMIDVGENTEGDE